MLYFSDFSLIYYFFHSGNKFLSISNSNFSVPIFSIFDYMFSIKGLQIHIVEAVKSLMLITVCKLRVQEDQPHLILILKSIVLYYVAYRTRSAKLAFQHPRDSLQPFEPSYYASCWW